MSRPALRCVLAVSGLAAMLAGCAERGDFGRVKPSLWNDTTGPFIGKLAAGAREEPVSWSMMTDDEKELRSRAYQFIVPTRERWGFEWDVGDLAAKRIIPNKAAQQDVITYFEGLKSWSDRSQRSRYERLRQDIENDRQLMGPFVATACRVQEMDRVRLKALDRIGDPDPSVREQAKARVSENEMVVRNVFDNNAQRTAAYRYALEHLIVESPDRDAVRVERVLTAWEADRVGLERCAPRAGISVSAGASGPPVRYMPKSDKPELPPK